MSECQRYSALLAEAFYNELSAEDQRMLDAHLIECRDCAAEFRKISSALHTMSRRDQPDPGPEFWDGYYARLQARMTKSENSRKQIRQWIYKIAAAIAFISIGLLIGKFYFGTPKEQIAQGVKVSRPSSLVDTRAVHFLERSQVLLVGMINMDEKAPNESYELSHQKQVSHELVQEASYLKGELKNPRERKLRQLVSELQIILIQIANMEQEGHLQSVEMVKGGIDRKGILLKINLEQMQRTDQRSLQAPETGAITEESKNMVSNFYKMTFMILLVVRLMVAGAGSSGADSTDSDEAGKSYSRAYNLVLDEKWSQAVQALEAHLKQYPQSSTADDAAYWLCHAKEESGVPPEQSAECYKEFIRLYPKSEYVDDAKQNYIRLAHQLAKSGKPQYEPSIKSMQNSSDNDVKLAALYAMANSGDESALPTILDYFEKTQDEDQRSKILYVLADFDSPKVTAKLAEIAQSDPSVEVRKKALYALADKGGKEAFTAIQNILQSKADVEVRKAALFAIGNMEGVEAVRVLSDVARKDQDEEVAKAATYAIGNVEGKDALAALQSILKDATSTEVRKAALYALANSNATGSVSILRGVAMSDKDAELRKAAVYAIANIEGDESFAALKEILTSSNEPEAQEACLHAIADHGGPEAQQILTDTAINSENERLAKTAAYALADLSGKNDVTYMTDVLAKAKLPEVRKAILYAIGGHGGPAAVQALNTVAQQEKDPEIRIIAVRAMGDAGKDEVVPILLDIVKKDSDSRVRLAAVQTLGEIGTPKAKAALMEILGKK